MFKKILVPLDGSEQSWYALDYALEVGSKFSSEILVVHVIQPFYNAGFLAIPVDSSLLTLQMEDMQKNAEQVLALAREKIVGKGVVFYEKIEKGHPSERILALAKSDACDVIFIGSRGLSGIEEFVLGSVSSNIVQYSKVPVFIVKTKEEK